MIQKRADCGRKAGVKGFNLLVIKTLAMSVVFCLLPLFSASAYERIVVLYGAASPILKELGAGDKVVGVTRTDKVFKDAVKVGSHLEPNIELMKALRPDLIVAGSRRAFPEEIAKQVKARVFYYDPRSLEGILNKIADLGRMLGKEQRARVLEKRLRDKLANIVVPSKRLTAVYEISARPLIMAGRRSIITSIIEAAGGMNLIKIDKKHAIISPEKIIELSPDFYIYQIGPMNKNPDPPRKRPFFKSLPSKVIKVREFKFARPGIDAFDAAIKLNKIFRGGIRK